MTGTRLRVASSVLASFALLLVPVMLAAGCGSALKSNPDGGRDGGEPDGPPLQADAAPCRGFDLPDVDCVFGTPSYVCEPRATGWTWGYTCPDRPADAGPTRTDVADAAAVADVATGCVSVPVTLLPEPSVGNCPPTAQPAECAGGDVGAVVARNAACARAWGNVAFQCGLWAEPAAGQQVVAVQLNNCTDVIDTVTAVACDDHIELSYLSRGTCQSCDGSRSPWRAFMLPLDGRPVVAAGRHLEPPCVPPPLDAATGIDGGCPGTPIGASLAAESFRAYKLASVPGFNSEATFAADEVVVPGLWDELRAQLFTGEVSVDGETHSFCSFLYRECKLETVTGDCRAFGELLSGVVRNGAFYHSWGSGSGVYRSTLGKLEPVAGQWRRTTSIAYFNPGSGPPGLVVAREGDALLVYRARVDWGKVNEWQNAELIGTLVDSGDRLAIVDDQGQELSSTLP